VTPAEFSRRLAQLLGTDVLLPEQRAMIVSQYVSTPDPADWPADRLEVVDAAFAEAGI
jgi:hypothetical protein